MAAAAVLTSGIATKRPSCSPQFPPKAGVSYAEALNVFLFLEKMDVSLLFKEDFHDEFGKSNIDRPFMKYKRQDHCIWPSCIQRILPKGEVQIFQHSRAVFYKSISFSEGSPK
jgi:hypothetical protein